MKDFRFLFLSLCVAVMLCSVSFANAQNTAGATPACTLSAMLKPDGFDATTIKATQLIAAPTVPGNSIHVCSVELLVITNHSLATESGLVYGTGANCATGTTNLTPQWIGFGDTVQTHNVVYGRDAALIAPQNTAVCANFSAAPQRAQVLVTYAVY